MKKIFACMTLIIVFLTSSLPVSAIGYYPIDPPTMGKYTVLDDKGMLADYDYYKREGYKILYDGEFFYRAMPAYRSFSFVLDENVKYEDVNDRIIEIFREFYPPENYNYKDAPSIGARTYDGITTYTTGFADRPISSANDERVVEAKKYSKAMMKKLNEENLISAFYDFGEIYDLEEYDTPYHIVYGIDVDIDMIDNFIKENNIDCNIENVDDNYYVMNFNDDIDVAEQFLIAADIYEATSIKCHSWSVLEDTSTLYGENSLKDSSSEEPTEPTNEKISDPEEIARLLNDFAEECQIPNFKATVSPADEEISIDRVSVFWPGDTANGQIKYLIQKFIEEKNIDKTKITGIPGEMALIGWFCDINGDKKADVRDCAYLASSLSKGEKLNYKADYNTDGKVDVRDAAGLAVSLSMKK